MTEATEATEVKESWSFDYRITKTGGDVKLDIGDGLSGLANAIGSTMVTRAIGKGLIRIGTMLMESSVDDDEDDWEDE